MRLRPFLSFLMIAAVSSPLNAAPASEGENAAVAVPAASDAAKQAMDLFNAGDAAKAVELALPLAEKKDPVALYLLGFAHQTGKGVEASRDKALDYYRKATALKQKDATYRLASLLLASEKKEEREEARQILETAMKEDPTVAGRLLGEAWIRGLLSEKPDVEKAIASWQAAAEAGDAPSYVLLGNLYEGQYGFPEKKDFKKSIASYEKAVEKGDTATMVSLGSRLLSGDKSIQNEKEGRKWLQKAIEAKQYSAYLVLGDYEEKTKKDLKAALTEYERGKDVGQVDCTLRSADFYIEGKGTEKDLNRGLSLLEKAAEGGSSVAHFRLAVYKLNQEKPDLYVGYGHLLSAANGGLAEAQNELGRFYLAGKLNVADIPAAVAWFTRAAKAGSAPAQYNLAALYERGAGVDQSYANAGQLYALAANQGHGPSSLALAALFYRGIGTKPEPAKAWALATLAAERGVEEGKKLADEINGKLTEPQRAEAKKQLEDIKSGKSETPAEAPPAKAPAPAPKK